ncbi:glycosyltransferase involved in cell wall biosynthesis [Pedobacter sp. UYEF25]
MKIGIIAHLKHPIKPPFKGGLEAFTFLITKKLIERGHEVVLFASASSDKKLDLVAILSDVNYYSETGVRQKSRDMSSEYIEEHHAYLKLMLEIDGYELDVLFNNSLHYIPLTMASCIATPMVSVLHTPPFYELELAISAERKIPVVSYITVSEKNARSWDRFVGEIGVIYNGIDLSTWTFCDEGSQQDYAVWFGRIHPDKGLEYAIEAAKLAGIKLKVAGAVGDKKYYASKIAPLLNDGVEFVGLLNSEELNKLIGTAKVCLVTPVWEEPFGLVVAEAMACGTPIAGFSIGALPEIVTREVGRLVNFGETANLAIALVEASKLDRKAVRIYSEKHFDIEKTVDQYENCLSRYKR